MVEHMAGNADKGVIVGIDLGTTNSLVAVCDERGPRTIDDQRGEALLPSVVRYEDDGKGGLRAVVGRDAAEAAIDHPLTTVSSVKRLMGRSVRDAAGDLPYLAYRVAPGERGTARVVLPIGGRQVALSPEEVSASILRELKDRASRALGEEVRRAVVTVPAYFDDAQRQATRHAGRLAGLEVVRIVNEPTAAALAYGIGATGTRREETVVVYDLGGGTFDVSVLRITPAQQEGDTAFFEALSTAGDTRLGGDDADHSLVALFATEVRAMLGLPPEGGASLDAFPPATRRALLAFARDVKHRLSDAEQASVEIAVNEREVYRRAVARAEYESMIRPFVDRTLDCCRRALRDARLDAASIDAVILVGGATRTPLVRNAVAEFFGRDPYVALDPDRVVALGAAVQAAILRGDRPGTLLLDVIPLSLGVETVGGAVAKLIFRNSAVPARAVERFSTSVDGQTSILLRVVQGEREMAADCRTLGEFHLRGIPPMPAGVPQVEVEFLIDANGVLTVRAVERRSGRRASLQVVPNHGLSAEEVDRIERESFAHAREDMTRHRIVDLVANSRLDLKWIGERLERHRAELDPAYAASLGRIADALRSLVEAADADWRSVDPNALHAAKEALDRESVRLQEIAIAASLRADSP
ncbi:MAG: molecular chaperone DnaK [Leptolyngbya sp. PLA2]|nr:molecular chaperone DnaK [Leptolyngbya sp.]MCE7972131.1 molecular chaperone DnaK [Leptolyngbya sp. PL-A2]MCQ3941514.1 molecular chaperone DnaK [cyanobacterium CYA1]MDL1905734.1 molecular chaperone DnaK [Synechococcales cyanobacterium CNB]GIK20503.1 MAG: chaperone protein HscA [Planctomycetota bacterium]